MSNFNFLSNFYGEVCRLADLGILDLGEFIDAAEVDSKYRVSLHLPEIVNVLRKNTILPPLSVVSMVDVMEAHRGIFETRSINKPFSPIKHSVIPNLKNSTRIGMTISGNKDTFPKCLTDYLDRWLNLREKLANPNICDYVKVVNKLGKPVGYSHLLKEVETEEEFILKLLAVLNVSKGVHWMVDLETLGTETDSAIVQAGLAAFSPVGEGLYTVFFRGAWLSVTLNATIHIPSQGRVTYKETLEWWHTKNAANKHLLDSGTLTLPNLLAMLEKVLGKKAEVWANSPIFDIALLQDCYKTTGRDMKTWPVAFRDQWDVRTVSKVAGFNKSTLPGMYVKSNAFWEVGSNAHDALADVLTQIYQVQECYRKLKVNKRVITDVPLKVTFHLQNGKVTECFNDLEEPSCNNSIKLLPSDQILGISGQGGFSISFESISDIEDLISQLVNLKNTFGEKNV